MQLDLDLQPGDDRLFTDESLEQIEQVELGLLAFERGELDPTTVNEVFRAAHTLKGSAATIRHRRMADLTHAMEDIFGAVRGGTLTDIGPFADTLLATIDVLRTLVDEVTAGASLTDAAEPLTADLRARLADALGEAPDAASQGRPAGTPTACNGAAGPAPTDANSTAAGVTDPLVARLVGEAPPADGPRATLSCVVDDASPWQAIRLFQAIVEAEETGALVSSAPSREEVEGGNAGNRVVLLVSGEAGSLDDLREHLGRIDDLTIGAPTAFMEPPSAAAPAKDATRANRATPTGPAAAGAPVERRHVDLGPEARGLAPEQRLAQAGDRMKTAAQTIRIDVGRLDELMNLVGELVVHKTRLQREAHEVVTRLGDDPLSREVDEGAQQFARIAGQLQDQVTRLRMLPIETVFNRFPRVVRDLAARFGKEVELVIEGRETELDRSVLEEVGDPISHLVRNALDHGVELVGERIAAGKPPTGRVTLSARHGDGQILITVADDGHGIDPAAMRAAAVRKGLLTETAAHALSDEAAIELIFAPGFSTATLVTDVSGRGVGMDVVRTNIAKLGGRVDVRSTIGTGTTFELSLPLTLAIVGALLVRSGERICALPLTGVVETLRIPQSALSTVRGHHMLELRGRVVPVTHLDTALGDAPRRLRAGDRGFVFLVVVRSLGHELALAVDEFVGEQDIVLKSLGSYLGRVPGVAGATVMADGRVALVVDISAVIKAQSPARQAAVDRTDRASGRPYPSRRTA